VLSVVLGGFYFTLLTTAGSVVAIRKLFAEKTNVNIVDDATEELVSAKNEAAKVIDQSTAAPVKAFSDKLVKSLRIFTAATGAAALLAAKSGSSAAGSSIIALFMLSTTLHNFVFGARLPKKFTKVVHPLVTCTALTWNVALLFAALCGTTFKSMLKGYRTGNLSLLGAGAGDVLLFLLGPAVVSLAISMYDRRQLMKANFKEVVTAIGVSSFGGLFGTAAAVRFLGIASPYLRLSLLSRNITSPLAMAIASILGADVSLAVSMVVVTGLFGANFGTSILDSFGIQDPVARGLGMGAAAHGLGTAAIVNEKDAFPFSAISMALTASACTVLVSIPVIRKMTLQLALGV
jgi:putative effector of murein hydrolase